VTPTLDTHFLDAKKQRVAFSQHDLLPPRNITFGLHAFFFLVLRRKIPCGKNAAFSSSVAL